MKIRHSSAVFTADTQHTRNAMSPAGRQLWAAKAWMGSRFYIAYCFPTCVSVQWSIAFRGKILLHLAMEQANLILFIDLNDVAYISIYLPVLIVILSFFAFNTI